MVGTRQAEVLAELSADLEIVASEVQTLVILGHSEWEQLDTVW